MLLMVMVVSKEMMHLQLAETQFTLSAASETTDSQQICPTSQHGLVCCGAKGVGACTSRLEAVQVSYSGRVLIEFRNGISDERLTAMQMYPRNCNVYSMLRPLERPHVLFDVLVRKAKYRECLWVLRLPWMGLAIKVWCGWRELREPWTPTSQKQTFGGQDIRLPLEVLSENHFASWC